MKLRGFLAAAIGSASVASAFSLYDSAPMVGVPESQSARYYVSMKGGVDTNPQSSTDKSSRKTGYFVNGALSTSYSDVESVDKLTYGARLGAYRYFGGKQAGKEYSSDCSLNASLGHAFSAMSRYNADLSVTYTPEPGYDNGVSAQGRRGDTLAWTWNNVYSQAMDARWSWHASAMYSGTQYEDKSAALDDRQYLSGGMGLNFKETELTTYTLNGSWREEYRSNGAGSHSQFLNVGISHALDIASSYSVSVGAQRKTMSGSAHTNPTLDASYRRSVADGVSVNAYVRYSDENVDNYNRVSDRSYESCATWRAGAYGTYVFSPDVSYVFRVQYMHTDYKRGEGMESAVKQTIMPSLTMRYNFTPQVEGEIGCEYTYYMYKRGKDTMYTRWRTTAGLTYRF